MDLNVSPGQTLHCHAEIDQHKQMHIELTNTAPARFGSYIGGYSMPEHDLVARLYITSAPPLNWKGRSNIRRIMEASIDHMVKVAKGEQPQPEAG